MYSNLLNCGLCFTAGLLAFGLVAAGQEVEPVKAIPVCELMHAPAKFNGQTIAIRGLQFSDGQALYLRGENCDGVVTTYGHQWDPVVLLSLSQEAYESKGLKFRRLQDASIKVASAVIFKRYETGEHTRPTRITATYSGLFETRNSFDGASDHPHAWEAGFGPGNWAPGQLWINSVDDIVVEFEEKGAAK